MIVMFMFVIVFVVRASIAEAHLAGQAGISQESERAIDGRLAHSRILLTRQTIKVLARDMAFGAQENVENKLTLRRALQTLLLNVLEENFLLFGHHIRSGGRFIEKTTAFYTLLNFQRNEGKEMRFV